MRSLKISLAVLLFAAACVLQAGPAPADSAAKHGRTVTLYGAGSLRIAMREVADAFQARTRIRVRTEFGPSGSMRERIEQGEPADVFTSANLEHPQALVDQGLAEDVVLFARNRLCAIARPSVGLTTENVLERALDPAVRLGTSTPVSDPSGDYAWEMFRKADVVRPGSYAALDAKALKLVGGPQAPPIPEGRNSVAYMFETNRADMFLAYCTSGRDALLEIPDLTVVDLPPELAVGADYGMTVLRGSNRPAYRLALFILSAEAQDILASYGFGTPTLPEPPEGGS